MRNMRYLVSFLVIGLLSFGLPRNLGAARTIEVAIKDTMIAETAYDQAIKLVEFAKTFIGTPYVWGSANPSRGFDCSGFVKFISNQFNYVVPRTSAEYAKLGTPIPLKDAQAGDIILFTGRNHRSKRVGHMGIITENTDDGLQFIHSSSGSNKGVKISELDGYYKKRFVKIVRVLPFGESMTIL